jgi:microcystin-dependent protein
MAEQTVPNTGGSQAHNNMQPFLTMNFIIALVGLYPSRS